MTIQRQYSLPNCTLTLEGLSDGGNGAEVRPVMAILLNAECTVLGHSKSLAGGREFLESLVTAVSYYAQEFLSGIHLPVTARRGGAGTVQLQRVSSNLHRLSMADAEEMNLTTVQLFDLVDAVDQFFADTQTLPDLSLQLVPVPRRYVSSQASMSSQVVPATVGISGLAVVAAACFMLPVPQVRKPDHLILGASPSPSPTASSPQASASPATPPSVAPTASPQPTQTTAKPDLAQLEAALNGRQEITDPAVIKSLGQKLTDQIDRGWKTRSGVKQAVAYQLGVAKDGSIVGYRPADEAARQAVDQTPLQDLLYIPTAGSPVEREAIAQFRVLFNPNGTFELTPPAASSSAAPSPVASATTASASTEITDAARIQEIYPKLYDQLNKSWQNRRSYPKELVFRVRVNSKGNIVDYEPYNQPAADYAQETPLKSLGKEIPVGREAPAAQEPLALFKVVFTSNQVIQVSPWRGWPAQ